MVVDNTPMIVGLVSAVLAPVLVYLVQRREQNRRDRIDPVALVTGANKAAYDALQGTIETLQTQVVGLSAKLDDAEHNLAVTNVRLAEVQADLLVTKTENRVLQAKVVELTRLLSEHQTG